MARLTDTAVIMCRLWDFAALARAQVSEKEADKWLPAADPVREERQGVSKLYESCAVVGSSGVLLLEDKGAEIDSHEFVMRFNGAPTKGLERCAPCLVTMSSTRLRWMYERYLIASKSCIGA